MRIRPRLVVSAVIAASLVTTGGCASSPTGRVARPSAFPTAPSPSADRPAVLTSTRPPDPEALVRTATGLRGVPYRPGGDSPAYGFDCSGFVRYVFGLYHVELPRSVGGQYALGSKVTPDHVREGDLVFFSTTARGPSHVGLAIGHGEFIHAPSSSGVVRVERLDVPYWRDRTVGVKRLF